MPTPEEMKAAQEAEAAAQAAAAAAAAAGTPEAKVKALEEQLAKERAERQAANAEAQKHRKRIREIEEATKKAEETALAEQGKHRELAESRGKELEALKQELEPLRARVSTYDQQQASEAATRRAQVDAEFNALPDAVREGIAADADPSIKTAVIRAYRTATGSARPPIPPATAPKPASGASEPPPEPTSSELLALGDPGTKREERQRIQAKLGVFNAWKNAHP